MAITKLGLIGPAGRMGAALREHLAGVPDIQLHAELARGGDVAQFITLAPDVVVDLSKGPGVDEHGPTIVKRGIPYIVGATGYKLETLELLRGLSDAADSPVLIVPNFSLGANLMLRFAAQAARLMESPVVTERHHLGKADAPSGTALFTAHRIGEATARTSGADLRVRDSLADTKVGPTEPAGGQGRPPSVENIPGVLGGSADGVAIHSLRGAGYLAEQEVRFSLPGESLSIEHRSIDRRCFMSGIIYAIRNIGLVRGLVVGLDAILEL